MIAEETLVRAFAEETPEEVARIFERLPASDGAHLLEVLGVERACLVLAAADPGATARALRGLPADAARALLAELDPRAAVEALRQLDGAERDTLFAALSAERRALFSSLTSYPIDTAAGRVDPRAPALFEDLTASEVLERLADHPGRALHYVYAVDHQRHLTGVANLRELMAANPRTPLASFMTRNPSALRAGDGLILVVRHPGWREHHALPVVDGAGRYLGALRYSTFRAIESELGRAGADPDASQAAGALAELCAIGVSAVARVAAAALSAERSGEGARR